MPLCVWSAFSHWMAFTRNLTHWKVGFVNKHVFACLEKVFWGGALGGTIDIEDWWVHPGHVSCWPPSTFPQTERVSKTYTTGLVVACTFSEGWFRLWGSLWDNRQKVGGLLALVRLCCFWIYKGIKIMRNAVVQVYKENVLLGNFPMGHINHNSVFFCFVEKGPYYLLIFFTNQCVVFLQALLVQLHGMRRIMTWMMKTRRS